MYILKHAAEYVTAQGTRPFLTTNARLALTFDTAEQAENASDFLSDILNLPLDIERA